MPTVRKSKPAEPTVTADQVLTAYTNYMDLYAAWVSQNGGTIPDIAAAPTAKDGRGGARQGAGRPKGRETTLTPKRQREAVEKAEEKKPVLAKQKLDPDTVYNMSITELRALALKLNLREKKLKDRIIEELEEKNFLRGSRTKATDETDGDEYDDDEEDYESGEDEDDEGEESGEEGSAEDEAEDGDEITREELEEMDLKELQQLAKDNDIPAKEWRGLDQEALVDLLMGDEGDEGEDGSDEGEADEEDDEDVEDSDGDEDEDESDSEEDEDEPLEISEEELNRMSAQELRDLCKELGIKIPIQVSRDVTKLRNLILDQAEDDE
jgi:hypothetical protein